MALRNRLTPLQELSPLETWDHRISSQDFHRLQLDMYQKFDVGWDVSVEDQAPYVLLELVFEEGEQSFLLAEWADNNNRGLFYYRDYTKDGRPSCRPGDIYWAGFWFQKLSDAKEFARKTQGIGTWDERWEDWQKRCEEKRYGKGGANVEVSP